VINFLQLKTRNRERIKSRCLFTLYSIYQSAPTDV